MRISYSTTIFGDEKSTVCWLEGDTLIRKDSNNFSREWTQHAMGHREGTSKRNWGIYQKGRISKEKSRSVGFGKKERNLFLRFVHWQEGLQQRYSVAEEGQCSHTVLSVTNFVWWECKHYGWAWKFEVRMQKVWKSLFLGFWETGSRQLTGNRNWLAKIRKQVFAIYSISRISVNFPSNTR